jgi:hypothetical protein
LRLLSSLILQARISTAIMKINAAAITSGAGTAYLSGTPEFTSGF